MLVSIFSIVGAYIDKIGDLNYTLSAFISDAYRNKMDESKYSLY